MTTGILRPQVTAPRTVGDRLAVAAEVTAAHAGAADRDARFPVEALDALRHNGLLGLLVPVEYGGLGGGPAELVEAGIALGRADMSVSMIFVMHCQQVAALVAYGSAALRDRLLPAIAAGEVYLGSVTTEAGTGGHLLTAEEALRAEPTELRVERFAPICTGGAYADGFLITMRSPYSDSPNQVSLVYAGREQLRITTSGDWDPLGMRASHSVALRLDGSIGADQVLGEHGDFREIATTVFGPMAHIGWASAWLGTAAGALSRVLTLLRSPAGRNRFDLGSELLLTRLSKARQRVDTVHALLRHTLGVLADAADVTATPVQLALNGLKITAAEQCHAAVDDLIDALGLRHGYLKDSSTGLERAYRDLRSAALNYSNDRLHLADGRLALLDQEVRLV